MKRSLSDICLYRLQMFFARKEKRPARDRVQAREPS